MGEDKVRTYACPRCGSNPMRVVDSRPTTFMGEKTIIRRRHCPACGNRFRTYEISEDNLVARVRHDELVRKSADATISTMVEMTNKLRSLLK